MSWDTVAHIKDKYSIPLIVKGVMDASDAARCVEAGVDVVYVSNHGGRQLDHMKACIDALPDVVEAVDGRVPVVVDGGFLRAQTLLKRSAWVQPRLAWGVSRDSQWLQVGQRHWYKP